MRAMIGFAAVILPLDPSTTADPSDTPHHGLPSSCCRLRNLLLPAAWAFSTLHRAQVSHSPTLTSCLLINFSSLDLSLKLTLPPQHNLSLHSQSCPPQTPTPWGTEMSTSRGFQITKTVQRRRLRLTMSRTPFSTQPLCRTTPN